MHTKFGGGGVGGRIDPRILCRAQNSNKVEKIEEFKDKRLTPGTISLHRDYEFITTLLSPLFS